MSSSPRLTLTDISRSFKKDVAGRNSALSWLLAAGTREQSQQQVLQDISFSVSRGETFGIIGRNGSGKSTLLKIIAGIMQPDTGRVTTDGSIVYLPGFGQGLRRQLSVRENIFLVGALAGLRDRELKPRIADITAFAGLPNDLDTKVYQFSSGMVSRLAFSITIHCVTQHNPDIILIDEAFGSGDMEFRDRATAKMDQLVNSGATVIVVSHSPRLIKQHCHRVGWLKDGHLTMIGDTKNVLDAYREEHKSRQKKFA